MFFKGSKLRASFLVLLLAVVSAVPAFAGSAVIGSVAGSMNATVGGQALVPNAVLFSGDSVQVKDGVAVVAIGQASRMVFGHDTVASFLKGENEVTVLLGQGNVSFYHADDRDAVRLKVGEISVSPAPGFKTLGEVAMLNGTVIITAKEGSLVVENNGHTINVAKGKSIAIAPKMARAPQPGGTVSSGTTVEVISLVAAVAAAALTGVALERADNAKSAANTADSAAAAADAAASAAAAAAAASAAVANSVGCALNLLANSEGLSSPYVPPAGETCPT